MKPAKIALAVLVVIALVALGRFAGGYFADFAAWVQGLGPAGPLVFILAYAAAAVAFVPGSLLTLAGGAIFGVAWGTLYVFLAASLGASLAFLIARYVARAEVERRLAGNPNLAAIDRAVGAEGRKVVFLMRLSPAFPFSLLNYALGLTKVRFADYLVACVGMLPGTLLYVYTGKLAGDVATVASGAAPARGPAYWALLAVGLVATLLVTVLITRTARRALEQATAAPAAS